ncbi:MAG: Hpt domain-containing protein [Parasporobacterium sp.]|nr:Hpt domain-containing protein [Parasporobacterium sp.]
MLTIDALREYGANVEEGLSRCLGKEDFYLKLVNMALRDAGFDKLKAAVEANDKEAAFEAAHALKGVLGNLALTPIFTPASEMTELLRAKEDADYDSYLKKILEERDRLAGLAL